MDARVLAKRRGRMCEDRILNSLLGNPVEGSISRERERELRFREKKNQ